MLIRSGEAPAIGWSRIMLYSGFNTLHRSVIRRQTGFAARITRTLSRYNNHDFNGHNLCQHQFDCGSTSNVVDSMQTTCIRLVRRSCLGFGGRCGTVSSRLHTWIRQLRTSSGIDCGLASSCGVFINLAFAISGCKMVPGTIESQRQRHCILTRVADAR